MENMALYLNYGSNLQIRYLDQKTDCTTVLRRPRPRGLTKNTAYFFTVENSTSAKAYDPSVDTWNSVHVWLHMTLNVVVHTSGFMPTLDPLLQRAWVQSPPLGLGKCGFIPQF